MSAYHNLLVRQVRAEAKKSRMIFYTIIILSFIYLTISLVFGDMGLVKYLELNRTRTSKSAVSHPIVPMAGQHNFG